MWKIGLKNGSYLSVDMSPLDLDYKKNRDSLDKHKNSFSFKFQWSLKYVDLLPIKTEFFFVSLQSPGNICRV